MACIGDGKSILFWRDRWINGFMAQEIAPAATAVVTTRRKNHRKVDVALEGNHWLWDVAEGMTPEVRLQCVRLWEAISAVERNPTEPDRFRWAGTASGQYNTKDTYERLIQGSVIFRMHKPIWKSFAPLKCKIYCWIALKDIHWTSARRHRHGLQDHIDLCRFCLQEDEMMDHLLAQCPYARQVWFGFLQQAGVLLAEPGHDSSFEDWWCKARRRINKADRRRFDTLVILAAWSIWK
jgi:hypothetical protein